MGKTFATVMFNNVSAVIFINENIIIYYYGDSTKKITDKYNYCNVIHWYGSDHHSNYNGLGHLVT